MHADKQRRAFRAGHPRRCCHVEDRPIDSVQAVQQRGSREGHLRRRGVHYDLGGRYPVDVGRPGASVGRPNDGGKARFRYGVDANRYIAHRRRLGAASHASDYDGDACEWLRESHLCSCCRVRVDVDPDGTFL